MININTIVGQAVGVPIIDTAGLTLFPTLSLLTDSTGSITSLLTVGLSTPVEIGLDAGIYSVVFTPTAIGNYYIKYAGAILAHIQVAAQDVLSIVKNIEDESLGSWSWDKVTGILTLLRQTGVTMATYAVVDTTLISSRNRLT